MSPILLEILRYAYWVLTVYFYLMFATIIISWTPLRTSRLYGLLERLTSLYLRYFRGWIVIGGTLDLTPMLGLVLYQLLLTLVAGALR